MKNCLICGAPKGSPECCENSKGEPQIAGSANCSASACKTAEQHLKGIFQKLDAAEKLQEPERTNQLRRMIKIALDDLEWVKMPND